MADFLDEKRSEIAARLKERFCRPAFAIAFWRNAAAHRSMRGAAFLSGLKDAMVVVANARKEKRQEERQEAREERQEA